MRLQHLNIPNCLLQIVCFFALFFLFLPFSFASPSPANLDKQIIQIKGRVQELQQRYLEETVNYRKWLAKPIYQKYDKKLSIALQLDYANTKADSETVKIQLKAIDSMLEKESEVLTLYIEKRSELGWDNKPYTPQAVLSLQQKIHSKDTLISKYKALYKLNTTLVRSLTHFQTLYNDWLNEMSPLKALIETESKYKLGLGAIEEIRRSTLNWQKQLVNLDKLTVSKARFLDHQYTRINILENINIAGIKKILLSIQSEIIRFDFLLYNNHSIPTISHTNKKLLGLVSRIQMTDKLITDRVASLKTRQLLVESQIKASSPTSLIKQKYNILFKSFRIGYFNLRKSTSLLDKQLSNTRAKTSKILQHQLSLRQLTPGFSRLAWQRIARDFGYFPVIVYQEARHLVLASYKETRNNTPWENTLILTSLLLFLGLWLFVFKHVKSLLIYYNIENKVRHNIFVNLLLVSSRIRYDILASGFFYLIIALMHLQLKFVNGIFWALSVWVIARTSMSFLKIIFYENSQNRSGRDVAIYRYLRLIIFCTSLVFVLIIFSSAFSLSFGLIDILERLFMLLLLIFSLVVIKNNKIFCSMILNFVDERRSYLKKILLTLVNLTIGLLFFNSILGLLGYMNLVKSITYYESLFLLVFFVYQLLDIALQYLFKLLSLLMIKHMANGWLLIESILKPVDMLLRILLFVVGVVALMYFYGFNNPSLIQSEFVSFFTFSLYSSATYHYTVLYVFKVFIALYLLFWVTHWAREFSYRMFFSKTQDVSLRNSLSVFSQYIFVLFAFYIVLSISNIDLSSVKFILGGLAVGFGFGLRDLASNVVSGLLMLIERPLRLGDFVTVSSYEGEVTHIGLRSFVITSWDRMSVYVPNSEVFSKSFSNWTRQDSLIRTVITIKVNRSDDPIVIQKIIEEELSTIEDIAEDPPVQIYMTEINESLLKIDLRYFINLKESRSRPAVRSDVLFHLNKAFAKHGIHPPYPVNELSILDSNKI
jgi:potassium efflux system protein